MHMHSVKAKRQIILRQFECILANSQLLDSTMRLICKIKRFLMLRISDTENRRDLKKVNLLELSTFWLANFRSIPKCRSFAVLA